jgi:hypothetical protein
MRTLFRQIEYRALSASAFAEHEALVDRRRLVRLAAIQALALQPRFPMS